MANASFIRSFCKAVKKLRHSKLTPKKRRSLQKYKKELKQLVSGKTTLSRRRRILSQEGGNILDAVLSAIPVVGTAYSIFKSLRG